MGSTPETITEDELRKTVKKAANDAAKNATAGLMNEFDDDYEEEEFEEEEYENDDSPSYLTSKPKVRSIEEIKRSIAEQDEFDIFDDVGDELAKSGIFVTYAIYKGGKYFTTEEHPYSWDRLQSQRGGGHYKVVAKDHNKKYIKAQTRVIAETPEDKASVNSNSPRVKEGPGTMEILAMLEQSTSKAKEEARREAREQREQFQQMLTALKPDNGSSDMLIQMMANSSKENMAMLTAMITAMKPKDSSNQLTQMMMEMQKTNMTMMQTMQQQTSQLIDKMNDKFERGLEKVAQIASHQPEAPEFDAWKVMQLQKDAEERGEKRMKDLFDLVDMKADEKAKFMTDKEPESTTDMLLKNFLPILGQVAAAKSMQPQPVPQVARRAVRPTGNPALEAPRRVVPQNRSEAVKRTEEAARSRANSTGNGNGSRAKPQINSSILDQIDDVEQNAQNDTMVNEQNRNEIIKIVLPLLVGEVNQGKGKEDVPEIVELTLQQLHGAGLDIFTIERYLTPEIIEAMVTQYGLPDVMAELLREYYVKLIERTREIRKAAGNQKA